MDELKKAGAKGPVLVEGRRSISSALVVCCLSEQAWKTYLFQNFCVSDPAKLTQAAVEEVLAWLTQQQEQESRTF